MEPIRIRTKIESETLHLPQLKPLIGQTVEITIETAPALAEAFYARSPAAFPKPKRSGKADGRR